MKLDYDVLSNATTYLDAVKERCLDLRDLKIAKIENLAMTKDANDTIDLTNNDITLLHASDFPPLHRLSTLLCSANRISSVDPKLKDKIPALKSLILCNNNLEQLGDLAALGAFKGLIRLALVGNPVCAKKNYRLWVIFNCPSVRVLDFRRVKDAERKAAKELFSGSKEAKTLASETAAEVSTLTPGEGAPQAAKQIVKPHTGPSPEEAERIKAAIEAAGSLEEVARLKRQLEGGSVPSAKKR
ncbi:U2 small nuclear ribonucleoprotein A' [Chytriomyces hyalinus]|nr:U2 small nuclear ribonucleoprotein A' [Chytriomyces hyalinus]KAJ3401957.1 U2 small nuclear ribonucleoprotein A' [Chytriomyces hyalinus]